MNIKGLEFNPLLVFNSRVHPLVVICEKGSHHYHGREEEKTPSYGEPVPVLNKDQ